MAPKKTASKKSPTKSPKRAAKTPAVPAVRADSKKAAVIELLSRTEGATVAEIMAVTGWLAHTVRGFLAGALKKELAKTPERRLISSKASQQDRRYVIHAT